MYDLLTTLFGLGDIYQAFQGKILRTALVKGSVLIQAGRINNDLFFLEKGIARGYYYSDSDKDNDITSWIVSEGCFVAVPHSFLGRKPSAETVEVLEKSVVYSISYDDLDEIIRQYPEVNYIKIQFLEKYLIRYDEHLRALRSASALKRLLFFEKYYPRLLNRVQQKYIASFLGITPQTLSKIRSERIRKKR